MICVFCSFAHGDEASRAENDLWEWFDDLPMGEFEWPAFSSVQSEVVEDRDLWEWFDDLPMSEFPAFEATADAPSTMSSRTVTAPNIGSLIYGGSFTHGKSTVVGLLSGLFGSSSFDDSSTPTFLHVDDGDHPSRAFDRFADTHLKPADRAGGWSPGDLLFSAPVIYTDLFSASLHTEWNNVGVHVDSTSTSAFETGLLAFCVPADPLPHRQPSAEVAGWLGTFTLAVPTRSRTDLLSHCFDTNASWLVILDDRTRAPELGIDSNGVPWRIAPAFVKTCERLPVRTSDGEYTRD